MSIKSNCDDTLAPAFGKALSLISRKQVTASANFRKDTQLGSEVEKSVSTTCCTKTGVVSL